MPQSVTRIGVERIAIHSAPYTYDLEIIPYALVLQARNMANFEISSKKIDRIAKNNPSKRGYLRLSGSFVAGPAQKKRRMEYPSLARR
jgi:hypothetical protein